MNKLLSLFLLSLCLSGCGDSNTQAVQKWMEMTKNQTRPMLPKLSEPKKFIPFSYDEKDQIDPFNPAKLMAALSKMRMQGGHGLKPDMDRRREALEANSLDTLKMVGTLTKGRFHYALLQSDLKVVYQVKAGNYVGQNFGLITRVNDDSVEIKEIVLDAAGDWVERMSKLELQEAKK